MVKWVATMMPYYTRTALLDGLRVRYVADLYDRRYL
jgi:hypothetical protein